MLDSDPILEAVDLKDAGDHIGAHRILVGMLAVDLRCLDAHAHLGNLSFGHHPGKAIRHYEAGVRIGELSLAAGFDGVLPWGLIDNRPFLRCMHGAPRRARRARSAGTHPLRGARSSCPTARDTTALVGPPGLELGTSGL